MEKRTFYPIQPSFVFHTSEYYKKRATNSPVSHYYSFICEQDVVPVSFVIPDGTIDLLFDADPDRPVAFICGTVLEPQQHIFTKNHHYFGARLVPGLLNRFMDVSAKELIGSTVDLQELLPSNKTVEQILSEPGFIRKISLFESLLASVKTNDSTDPKINIIQALLHLIYRSHGTVKIHELERYTLYSRQYLSRLFTEYTGIGLKQFCKIIRLQNVLQHMNAAGQDIGADSVLIDGFYDQSHFIRDFRSYIMLSPTEYYNAVHTFHYNKTIIEL